MDYDFHRKTASVVFNKDYDDVTDDERYMTKAITFGVMYGRQAGALARGELKELTGGNKDIAQKYIDLFWRTYPDFHKWTLGILERATTEGIIEVEETGRTRRFNLINDQTKFLIRNKAVNFPVQSLASDINLMAMIKLYPIMIETGIGRPLFPVHDSICFEIREDRLDQAKEIIKEVMEKPFFETNAIFEVDMKAGKSWAA